MVPALSLSGHQVFHPDCPARTFPGPSPWSSRLACSQHLSLHTSNQHVSNPDSTCRCSQSHQSLAFIQTLELKANQYSPGWSPQITNKPWAALLKLGSWFIRLAD